MRKKVYVNNSKATDSILIGLSNLVFVKVTCFDPWKEIWDMLQIIYEGDEKVKRTKLKTHRYNLKS